MKITVSDIEREGLILDIQEPSLTKASIKTVGPVEAHLEIHRYEEEVSIKGGIKGHVVLQCSRCLIDFQHDIDINVDLLYEPLPAISEEESYEIGRDEAEIAFYRDDELDITEMIAEQILLTIPMKPLCDEQCKGLCPYCGADLNLQSCDCDKQYIDPRLAKLKTLLERKE